MTKQSGELLKLFKNTLFTNPKDIFYLTDCPFDGFWLFILNGEYIIISSKMMFVQCEGFFNPFFKVVQAEAGFSSALVALCKEKNVNSVKIDSQSVTLADFETIKAVLSVSDITLQPEKGLLNLSRYVKTDEEISRIKQACRIVSEVFDEIKKEIKAGSTELDVHYKILEKFAARRVTESFTPIVAFGENAASPHHASSARRLKEDDIILIDMGCKYKGYASDLTRTFFLGKINVKYQQVFDIVLNAQKSAINALKAGIAASTVDTAARSVISQAGYGACFIHSTGHGLGIDVHESPQMGEKSKETLKSGCVITVEPGIYLPDEFGVRIEDTVLITETGYEVLTNAEY